MGLDQRPRMKVLVLTLAAVGTAMAGKEGGKGKEFMEMMGGMGGKMPDMMENMGKPSKPGMGKPSKGDMVQVVMAGNGTVWLQSLLLSSMHWQRCLLHC